MSEKQKITLKEKADKLIKKIERAKNELLALQQKRLLEIGKLACKHGLDAYEDTLLDHHFSKLSKELNHGNSKQD
ncbi:MAG: hypothetical protein E6K54_08025 [Gammaproteobacteria bacterium]|nr:MAG: hypothetical protein E6K54_08025 [Gammaproteobacteria bacterium]